MNEVKRKQRFTVVIGNPPYSGVSANHGEWITKLIDRYRFVNGQPLAEKKVWLKNDYVKFLRLSQFAIESTGRGVVGLITDHSYLDSPTFRGLRFSLLQTFEGTRFLNLHGNSKRREQGPRGELDENVFDITQGTAIALLTLSKSAERRVSYVDIWGTRSAKYDQLLNNSAQTTDWLTIRPGPTFYLFSQQTADASDVYSKGWLITDVFQLGSNGVQTSRDSLVLAATRKELIERFAWIRDESVTDADIRATCQIEDKSFWNLHAARRALMRDKDWTDRIVSYTYRPLDNYWLYASTEFVHRLRREVMQHMERPNIALCVGRAGLVTEGQWDLVFVTNTVCDHNLFYRGSSINCPLYRYTESDELDASTGNGTGRSHSISQRFVSALSQALDFGPNNDHLLPRGLEPENILHYAYGVFFSPGYRDRNAELLNIDFPRLPLPGSRELFRDLAHLGAELVAFHSIESPALDHFITTFTGPKNPEVGRVGWSDDTVWLDAAVTKKGQPATPGTIGFRGVPEAVWNFHIGGYQVCEKWLKDRKGRTLSKDDIAHYQKIVVALNETIRLMQEIDVVIEQHGGWPGAFQTGEAQAAAPNVISFRPRIVQPTPKERYVTCVPLVPLKVAAGAFSDPQHIDDDGFEWAAVETKRPLRPGMFVAQVVGKSMEPAIPDGAYCLFAAPVEGTRQGKTVLVQLRDATDSESGERYTVKRYESEKAQDGDLWRHEKIILKPLNPDFKPIVLTGADEGELQVIAEFVEVVGRES